MNSTLRKQSTRGTVKVRVGPMFSGKTSWLNSEIALLADLGLRILKISHADDIRSGSSDILDTGSTHNTSFKSLSSKITFMRMPTHSDLAIDGKIYDVIGIDEGQFYPDLVEYVEKWSEEFGIDILVAGLDGTFERKKFGDMLLLCPLADEFIKLNAKCHECLKESGVATKHLVPAPFSRRLIASTEEKIIGGADTYHAVCYTHYFA